MNMNLILSVIVPIYNSEQFLSKCLDSLIVCNVNDIEFILINDGSIDKSEEICIHYCKLDSRFKYFKKINGGLSDARNHGLKKSNAKFITFLDSDDYVDKNYYDIVVETIIKYDVDIICTSRQFFNNNSFYPNFLINKTIDLSNSEFREMIMSGKKMDFSVCNKIFSKELIKGVYFHKNKICEDMGFFIDYIDKVSKCLLIPKINYYYRKTVGSISRKPFFKGRFDLFFYTEKIYKMNKNIVSEKVLKNFMLKNHIYLLFNILRSNNNTLFKKESNLLYKRILQRINFKNFIHLDYKRKIQFILSIMLLNLKF